MKHLLRGGVVNVAAERRGNTTEIVVRAEGPRLVMDANIRRALAGELQPVAARYRQPHGGGMDGMPT